jgi:hypothetical protein
VVAVSVHCIELDPKALSHTTMNPTEGMEKTNSATMERPEAIQEHFESLDPVEFARREKALLRKIDYRLMPCLLGMIVLKLVLLHRTKLGKACHSHLLVISTAMPSPMQESKELKKTSVLSETNTTLPFLCFLQVTLLSRSRPTCC